MKHNRSLARRNFLINIAGMLLPLAMTILTVPIYVRTLGDTRYGVLTIVWLLLGYVGFLDLGLTRATENALAQTKTQSTRAKLLVTSGLLNFVLGSIGSLILLVFGKLLFDLVLTAPGSIRQEVRSVLPWVASLFPLALVGGTIGGAFDSKDRFLLANILSVTGTAAGQVIPVLSAIIMSPSLPVVVPAAVISRAVTILISIGFVYWYERPLYISHFDHLTVKRLLRYGGWVTVSSVISPLLSSVDQFIIGSRIGLSSVTYYAIPMSLAMRGQVFAVALSRTLFPMLSRSDMSDAIRLSENATSLLAIGYAILCAPAIIVVQSVFNFWIGSDFAKTAAPVAEVLLIGSWINALAFIPFSLLQAQGRPDLTAKFHAAEIIPFIALLWLLTAYFGILGAAVAWSLRVAVDASLMFAAAGFTRNLKLSLLPSFFFILASFGFVCLINVDVTTSWIVGVIVALAIAIVGFSTNLMLRSIVYRLLRGLG